MAYAKDLIGQKFGKLTVISRNYEKQQEVFEKTGYQKAFWNCKCDCGNNDNIVVSGTNLKNKTKPTTSCGCYKQEVLHRQKNTKSNKWIFDGDSAIGVTSKGDMFYIDIEDYDAVKDFCWRVDKHGYVVANSRNNKNKIVRLHKIIMNKNGENFIVDHKDWNKLNNKKNNLRIATKSQNNMNIKRKSNNTSGYTGVTFNKRNNRYVARISKNGVRFYLGTYKTFKEAVEARHMAEIKMHSEWSGEINRNDFLNVMEEAEELLK